MSRSPFFLFVLLWLATALAPAAAYDNYWLQVRADQYTAQVLANEKVNKIKPVLDQAQRAARQGRGLVAIDHYQRLLATQPQQIDWWLALASAWQSVQADRNDALQRARQAAFIAYQKAEASEQKSRALELLGTLFADEAPGETLKIWAEAVELHATEALQARYTAFQAAHAFRFVEVNVATDTSRPEICLSFSENLSQRRDLQLADFVRLEPAVAFNATARGDRLCIDGVAFATNYQVTVREGLLGQSGHRLASDITVGATVGDRPKTLTFKGNGVVLPRLGRQGLPLVSTNIHQTQVEVLRVNDRNALNAMNNEYWKILDGDDIKTLTANHATRVATATLAIDSTPNGEITTLLPLHELIPAAQPGLYVVAARDATISPDSEQWTDFATQWLVISDLALTTIRGQDGLHVFVRSLQSGQPVANAHLRLLARNNAVLHDLQTDAQGYGRFDPGLLRGVDSQAARLLLVYSGPADAVAQALRGDAQAVGVDFSFLDLDRPAFDFSDRGVAGREAPQAVDAFLYTERGIYRPGETVALTALLRDARAKTVDAPLTLELLRGDDLVVQRWTLNADQQVGGAYHLNVPLHADSRLGTYTVKAFTHAASTEVGRVAFQVEQFIPQQIKVTLSGADAPIQPQEAFPIAVESAFLYGAPAAQLRAEASWTLRQTPKPFAKLQDHPFGDLNRFRFGLVDDTFEAVRQGVDLTATDGDGRTQFVATIDQRPDTSLPLTAALRVAVFEPGGRSVRETLERPFAVKPLLLGLNSRFGDSLSAQQSGQLELVALDNAGKPQAVNGLRYQLYREEHEYIWFQRDGEWGYESLVRDSAPLTSDTVATTTTAPTVLSVDSLDWGHYRAEIVDPATGAATSLRFRVGWTTAPSTDDRPDQLQVTLDRASYSAGDTAQVFVKAPFAGEVLVTVLSNRLWHREIRPLPADGATLSLPVNADWGPGAYVTAVAYQAGDSGANPNRAIGMTWLAFDQAPRTLTVQLDAPREWRPRQTVSLPVTIAPADGAAFPADEPIHLTVAAVDEGILQLTDFSSPDPTAHYFAKRRLGVDWRDIYGQLIRPEGREGLLRVGGDAPNRNLSGPREPIVRTVALFSGLVTAETTADGQRRAVIPLDLPDFNGELRLMAVAWSPTRLGYASRAVAVRDPVIAALYTPRFLAPGDRADLTLQLDNVSGVAGEYVAAWTASGAIRLADDTTTQARVTADAPRQQVRVPIAALQPGVGTLTVTVNGPNLALTRELSLTVRPQQAVTTRRRVRQLDVGATLALDTGDLRQFVDGTGEVQLAVATRPPLNVGDLLQRLDRYPYGCLEQTVSRALPLLVANDVAAAWLPNAKNDSALQMRVQNAVGRVLAMQQFAGNFGLWSAADGSANDWLAVYATDFLWDAQQAGYVVPPEALERALKFLDARQRQLEFTPEAMPTRGYLALVLAKANRLVAGDLRYLFDVHGDKLTTLGLAQVGKALALYNDGDRATAAFTRAFAQLGQGAALYTADAVARGDYATVLRDQAAVVALALDEAALSADVQAQLPALIDALIQRYQQQPYTNTQEQAWLLRAAAAMDAGRDPLELVVNGQAVKGLRQYQLNAAATALVDGVTLENRGTAPIWLALTESGVPVVDQPAAANGFTITRALFTRDGQPTTLDAVRQNDLVVVKLSGAATTGLSHEALVVDLLPAGFEIENAQLANDDGYAWLGERTSPAFAEARDDRFVAAVNLSAGSAQFAVAYLARAVTKGDFVMPAPQVEDMYRPDQFARGELAQVRVK